MVDKSHISCILINYNNNNNKKQKEAWSTIQSFLYRKWIVVLFGKCRYTTKKWVVNFKINKKWSVIQSKKNLYKKVKKFYIIVSEFFLFK
jgi:hypothetical protein